MGIEVTNLIFTLESPAFGQWHIEAHPAFGQDYGEPDASALLEALAAMVERYADADAPILAAPTAPLVAPGRLPRSVGIHPWSERAAALTGDQGSNGVRAVVAPDSMASGPDATDSTAETQPTPKSRTRNVPKGGNRNHKWTPLDDASLLEMVTDKRTFNFMATTLKREKQAVKHRLYTLVQLGKLDNEARLALR